MKLVNYTRSTQKGFSLIELMLTVAIVAIIAAIAYPSYTGYVAKGARADGHTALLKVANLQEQYYLDNRSYAEDMTALGLSGDPLVTEGGFYKVDSKGTSSFIATAVAQGVQATRDSDCATLTITDTGAKTPVECWK